MRSSLGSRCAGLPRPRLVAGDAGQSAQVASGLAALKARVEAARLLARGLASPSPTSRRISARATPTTRWLGSRAARRTSASSGSWARTISASSISGGTGATSPTSSRSPSSIGRARRSRRCRAGRRRARALARPGAGRARFAISGRRRSCSCTGRDPSSHRRCSGWRRRRRADAGALGSGYGLIRRPVLTHGREAIIVKIAILDDWQDVARSSADWSRLAARADLTFLRLTLSRPRTKLLSRWRISTSC